MIRLSGRRRSRGGRLASLGQNHDQGHREYVSRLPPEHAVWLRTKPFSAPPNYELARCLHSFAHIVDRLAVPAGGEVLDVGCGPGWLSEYLARCGYRVTGIDISEEMVVIARGRVDAIAGPIGHGVAPAAEFHAMPVHELPWPERFDAAVLYDAMHHFHDERRTLRAIRRALAPGGRIFIHEGVRPDPGSPGERELIEEMERFGTLESPFDPGYLREVVEGAGFVDVRQFVEVDALVDLSDPRGARKRLKQALRHPSTNTLVAMAPLPEGVSAGEAFRARIEAVGEWERSADGRELARTLVVTNTGASAWAAARDFPFPLGSITVGPYVRRSNGRRQELERILLPRPIAPGESVEVRLRIAANALREGDEVVVDVVREHVVWLGEAGSPPLVLSVDTG